MTILFYIALGYLLVTTGILYLNRIDFSVLPPVPHHYFDQQAPKVSICIPARNEANSIERCVRSAVDQQYPNFEVFVLDDNSTDETPMILERLAHEFPETLSIISGQPKPANWLGKSWACQQLADETIGDIIIFIDADTWIEPEATTKVVRAMGRDVVDFITLWPKQKLGTFWEKTVIPLVYWGLLTHLPSRYVYRHPKWLPSFLKDKLNPVFAAACGQFMAFKRDTYHNIGGHRSVKNEVVEDVALAKEIKRNGYSMKMYHGAYTVGCRMYQSAEELWQGFRKNFLAGFGNNIFLFIGMALLQFITFILPTIALPFLLFFGTTKLIVLCLIILSLTVLQRWIVDQWFNWNYLYGLLHPLAVSWFQLLGFRVLSDYFENSSAQWKGRDL
ncbi:glycosyltransferase [Fodinibius halophilus]|uniref:Glycosyltransferase n=1 Tax=Fodinibius halophilus TaxID=1736908 RepID=A0A6M1SX10_9BACT|nr:glycosyltransferase family 2 protein [Fodinibius halophilus]NGP88076.1 glycosyltransferase [Fodinibius halophilus]